MAARFRKVAPIVRLAGCDLLTIRPDIVPVEQDPPGREDGTFRWMHNEDAMAVEKLSEGIRKFYADARKIEKDTHARAARKAG